jgi:hypothetical protein
MFSFIPEISSSFMCDSVITISVYFGSDPINTAISLVYAASDCNNLESFYFISFLLSRRLPGVLF